MKLFDWKVSFGLTWDVCEEPKWLAGKVEILHFFVSMYGGETASSSRTGADAAILKIVNFLSSGISHLVVSNDNTKLEMPDFILTFCFDLSWVQLKMDRIGTILNILKFCKEIYAGPPLGIIILVYTSTFFHFWDYALGILFLFSPEPVWQLFNVVF